MNWVIRKLYQKSIAYITNGRNNFREHFLYLNILCNFPLFHIVWPTRTENQCSNYSTKAAFQSKILDYIQCLDFNWSHCKNCMQIKISVNLQRNKNLHKYPLVPWILAVSILWTINFVPSTNSTYEHLICISTVNIISVHHDILFHFLVPFDHIFFCMFCFFQ